MPPASDRPLRRVTMYFYADNIDWLQARYGTGWTGEIRDILDKHIKAQTQLTSIARELREDD